MTEEHTTIEPHTGLETEFPHRIGKVAKRELALHGYTRYEQLAGITAKDLLAIHGVGKKAIEVLREELGGRGLAFADEP
ncbi:helix-hairpin-helix domain-containing protein [Kibdelosporangium aridum]|uniref:DNA-binding protein n=1 Tax=Kibdelosporangium aridum TaxID=2030 RepID=A0A1W2EPT0_KIBAR|nr:hypothetical protein [Kibdelosporangium aridum]SMD11675.1 hypothetical protein SAMN05661093_04827 [Kibdelosporangium aridum]